MQYTNKRNRRQTVEHDRLVRLHREVTRPVILTAHGEPDDVPRSKITESQSLFHIGYTSLDVWSAIIIHIHLLEKRSQ